MDQRPDWIGAVRAKLVGWYAGARRDLPWRADQDPYRILVSETMLVQTTVAAVAPYFQRFLERFPSLEALAAADEADVVKAWEGLGYYRRARQLRAAAQAVMRDHRGVVPDDPEALRALPGVGRYIAGAILSLAYNRPAPIVEANTQRVLARWLAWEGELKAPATQSRLWEAAGRLVPDPGAAEFNQAFMELGALICAPRQPLCLVCPVALECRARVLGIQDQIPRMAPKPAPLAATEAAALAVREGRALVVRRGASGLWAGFWEFPTASLDGANPAGRERLEEPPPAPLSLAAAVARIAGARVRVEGAVATVRYSVTKYRVRVDAYSAVGLSEAATPGPGFAEAAWIAVENLHSLTFSSASRKLLPHVSRLASGEAPA